MRIDPTDPHAKYVIGPFGVYSGSELGVKPAPKDMLPHVKKIYVGGCIATGLGRLRQARGGADAHAHTHGLHKGWVCFQTPEDVLDDELRLHELAHILSGTGHDDKWRAAMTSLGQAIPDRYRRRRRKQA